MGSVAWFVAGAMTVVGAVIILVALEFWLERNDSYLHNPCPCARCVWRREIAAAGEGGDG